jgi:hypothetical protein
MPHCHWLLEAKPCWLCCTTLLRWTDNFTYTASIYEHGQTWTERDGASHPTERPSDGGLSSKDGSPAQATPHVLHARNAHECSLVRLFGLPGDNVFRYMSPSVVCNSRACWTSTYRGKYSNVKYSTCRALPSGSPSCSCCIPLPALTLALRPHLFLLFYLSPAHMHVCRQGDISRFSFRVDVFV